MEVLSQLRFPPSDNTSLGQAGSIASESVFLGHLSMKGLLWVDDERIVWECDWRLHRLCLWRKFLCFMSLRV